MKTSGAIVLNIVTSLLANVSFRSALTGATLNESRWNSIDPCLDAIECFGDRFNVTVSDPEDCLRYFVCVNTSLIPSSCPLDAFYDYINNRCAANRERCHGPCHDPSHEVHIIFESGTVESSQDNNYSPPLSNWREGWSLVATTTAPTDVIEPTENEEGTPSLSVDGSGSNKSSSVLTSDRGESSLTWSDPHHVLGSDVEDDRSSTSTQARSITTTSTLSSKEGGIAGVPTPVRTANTTPLRPTLPPITILANTTASSVTSLRASTQVRSTASEPSTRTTATKSNMATTTATATAAASTASHQSLQYTPPLPPSSSVASAAPSSTVTPTTSTAATRLATPSATGARTTSPFTLEPTIRTTKVRTSPAGSEEDGVSSAPSVDAGLSDSESTVSVTLARNSYSSSGSLFTESSADSLNSFVTNSFGESTDNNEDQSVSDQSVSDQAVSDQSVSDQSVSDQSVSDQSATVESISKTSAEEISAFTSEAQLASSFSTGSRSSISTSSTGTGSSLFTSSTGSRPSLYASSTGSRSSLSTSSAGSRPSLSTSSTGSRSSLFISSRSPLITDPAPSSSAAAARDQNASSFTTSDNSKASTTVAAASSSLVSSTIISIPVETGKETQETDMTWSASFSEDTTTLREDTKAPFHPGRSLWHSSDLRSSTTRSSSSGNTGTSARRSDSPSSSSTIGTQLSPSTRPVTPILDSCNPPFPCRLGDLLADPTNCERYFECVDSTLLGIGSTERRWTDRRCGGAAAAAAFLFDSVTNQCTHATDATCRKSCQHVIRHNVSMSPSVPVEGARLAFECSFSVVSAVHRVYVESMTWLLNDCVLSPPGEHGSNDIVIRQMAQNATTGVSHSTLVFNSVSVRYSGKVMCDVKYSQVFTSHAKSDAFDVRPLPVVQLIPISVTVLPKSNVTLTCSAIENEDVTSRFGISTVTFEWFQNGTLVTKSGGDVTITNTEKLSVLSSQISQSSEFVCRARNGFGVSKNGTAEVRVIKLKSSSGGELTALDAEGQKLICMDDEEGSWQWTSTVVNFAVKVPCRPPSKGFVTRQCVQGNEFSFAQWMYPDASLCVSGRLIDIWQQISDLESGIGSENETVISDLLFSFNDFIINRPPNSSYLSPGDYNSSITAVPRLLNIYSESPSSKFLFADVDTIFEATSALLDPFYSRTVSKDLETGDNKTPSSVMKSVDNFGRKWSKKLQPGQTAEVIKNNLAVQVEAQYASQVHSLSYPRRNGGFYPAWMYSTVDSIVVKNETLHSKRPADIDTLYGISSSYYRTLSNFFRFGRYSNSSRGLDSRILSLSIDGMLSYNLQPKVQITLQHRDVSEGFTGADLNRQCAFWNFAVQPNGAWSTVGCYRNLSGSNASVTICECDHLTNFAVLVSPSTDTLNSRDALILSIISLIGCIISIVSLILTIVVYATRWKKLKSHQAVVLINLCVALIIANVIFLAGVDRTEWHIGCQVVSVLLHYFFLAAFFLMLAEAFQLLLYTVFVFHVRRKRETAALIVGAWIIPLIIVAISMGVSQMKGYGDSDSSCWLSPSKGVYWAFVGPVLAVILINFVIMTIVLCRVARIQRPSEKKGSKKRLRATLWNVMVIAPVLGVAWVFGVFSVNNDLIVFQYIFAVANSLQGLFIFIFHALCNRRRAKSKYSVPGLTTSKQKQQNASSREQRSSSSYPQHHFPERRGGNRPGDVPPAELSDDIIIMGSAVGDRRPSEDTVDSRDPYQGYQTEITSDSSGICSSESSASSVYRGETSDQCSCNTIATEMTHCEDEDQRL